MPADQPGTPVHLPTSFDATLGSISHLLPVSRHGRRQLSPPRYSLLPEAADCLTRLALLDDPLLCNPPPRNILSELLFLFLRVYHTLKDSASKRQINKPKPAAAEEMEKIFKQVKEEQQNFDQAFEREQEHNFNYDVDSRSSKSKKVTSANGQLGKDSKHSGDVSIAGGDIEYLVPGATVRILSGPFVEFTGRLKDLDYTNKKATVGFTLFGKESYVDLELEQIAAETNDRS